MAFIKTLLNEAARQQRSRDWAAVKRRSADVREAFLYTVFRSRGFFVRRVTRMAREFLEAFGIALVASPLIAISSLKLWVMQLLLTSVVEGIYQALKGSVVDFRKLDRKSVAWTSTALVFGLQLVIGVVFFRSSANFPELKFLFVVRAASFLLESVLGAYYFDISSKQRIFIPPRYAYLLTLCSLGSLVIFSSLSPEAALYLIVLSHAAIRIADQWLGFKKTREAEKQYRALEKPLRSELQIESDDVSLKNFSRNDLKRIFVWGSLFVAPMTISLALRHMGHSAGSVLMWTMLGLMIRITERPFRAFSVDLIDSILKHQWDLMKRGLAAALRSSLLLSLVGLAALIAVTANFYTAYLPLISLMLLVSTFQRVMVNSAAAVGLDKNLFWASLLPRIGILALYFGAEKEALPSLLIYFIGFELLSALAGAWVFRDLDVARKIESDFVDRALALAPEPNYLPIHFLTLWKTLSPHLRASGVRQIQITITLSESYRSPRRMGEFLTELKSSVRPGDLILALSSQRLVAWMPGADDSSFKAVSQRLLLRFALQISDVQLIDQEGFVRSLRGFDVSPDGDPIRVSPEMASRLLSNQLEGESLGEVLTELARLTRPQWPEGQWWMRDREGEWVSQDGRTLDPQRLEFFSQLEQNSASEIFLHKPVHRSDLRHFEEFHSLRPFGAMAAVFVYPSSLASPDLSLRLAGINAAILDAMLESPAPNRLEMNLTRFKVISTLAEAICRRHKIAHRNEDLRGLESARENETLAYVSRRSARRLKRWSLGGSAVLMLGVLFPAQARAFDLFPKRIKGELICLGERPDRPLTLVTPEASYHVVDVDFVQGAFVPPYLACTRWLTRLRYQSWFEPKAVGGQRLLVPEGSEPEIRLSGDMRSEIYNFCLSQESCRVRAPFKWLSPLVWWRNLPQKSNAFQQSSTCQAVERPRGLKALSLEELKRGALTDPQDLRISFSPRHTLGDEILERIRADRRPEILLASSMNFSGRKMAEIASALRERPEKNLMLLFDFNPTSLEDDLLDIMLAKIPKNLRLMPIFSSSEGKRYFHLKGLTSLAPEGRFYFSSANLKTNERFHTFDMGFSARQPQAAASMAQSFLDVARRACERAEQLQCSLDSRYEPEDALRWFVSDQLRSSCDFIANDPALVEFSSRRHPEIFRSTAEWDAIGAYRAFVASATTKLRVSSHVLTLKDLIDEIAAARARKIPTEAVLGYRSSRPTLEDPATLLGAVVGTQALGTQAHTKALLVDDTRLIWGTGNMSFNGLVDSHEYFFYTEDARLAEAYRSYLRSFSPLSPTSAATPASAPPCAIWVPGTKALNQPELRALAAKLRATSTPGFYLPKTPEISRCLNKGGARMVCRFEDFKTCAAP